jgi:serine protease SohB
MNWNNFTKNRKFLKVKTKAQKNKASDGPKRGQFFVVDSSGSMDAHEVDYLREEVMAILCVAQLEYEVLIHLKSDSGVLQG